MKAGQILGGRYRLLGQIGAGGMGEVWRAVDRRLDTDVAVKFFHARDARLDADRARRLLHREAQITASLRNPHIVPVLDVADDATYLVMEYVPARNLRDIVKADGPLSPARAAEIGAQIADALRATHAADVVHGDVTPANVLIDRAGTARLTDFGIARRMTPGGTMTDVGLVHGAPGYIAPELADGDEATPASDMFGLGATLFAALEGGPPYGQASPVALVRRARDYGAHRFELLPCRATGPLTPVVERLLARSPKRRPTAATTCEVLRDTAQQTGAADVAVLSRDPLGPRIVETLYAGRRVVAGHAQVAATVAAVLVAATVVAVAYPEGAPARSTAGSTSRTSPSSRLSPNPSFGLSPSPSSQPTTVTAPAAIGDPHTVDPCALTAAGPLGKYGAAQVDPNYGNFDRCDVLVQAAAGIQVDVEAQFQAPGALAGAPSPSPSGGSGQVAVARPAAQPGECDRYLYLAGGYGVVVSAGTDPGQSGVAKINLCAMADTATSSAVAALEHGVLPRRSASFSNLARADACRLLTPAALAAVPGVDAARYQGGFGGFSCRWAAAGGTSVALRFDQNDPLDATDGTVQHLGGRTAYVQPGGDGADRHNCLVRVVYRSFSGVSGPTEELVDLVVSGDQSNDALCRPATALAAAASQALPATG